MGLAKPFRSVSSSAVARRAARSAAATLSLSGVRAAGVAEAGPEGAPLGPLYVRVSVLEVAEEAAKAAADAVSKGLDPEEASEAEDAVVPADDEAPAEAADGAAPEMPSTVDGAVPDAAPTGSTEATPTEGAATPITDAP